MTPEITSAFIYAERMRVAGRLVAARDAFATITAAAPGWSAGWHGLGVARLQLGDQAGSLEALRIAIATATPEDLPTSHSALIYALCHHQGTGPTDIGTAADQWWQDSGRPKAPVEPLPMRPSAGRRVRLGYLGDGWYTHPIALLSGWVARHNRERFEVVVYDSSPRRDRITDHLAGSVDQWRDVANLDDDALAAMVSADGIDVLVDLNGHSGRHRLGVLARRPAPLVGTACGFATTGIPYAFLVADDAHIPAGAEAYFSERLVRLPAAVTFSPPPYAPTVARPPSQTTGAITFGAFNRLAKITDTVLNAWGRVLAAVPESRLLLIGLGMEEPEVCQRIAAAMAANGVHASRLLFEREKRHPDLLSSYARVDIALDTFPYTGGLTTLEAFWQGVPVVTLAGEGMHTRHAAAHLSAVGLSDLVATDIDGYVAAAVGLARAADRLSELRGGLRSRLAASPVCDARGQAQALEKAIIVMLKEIGHGS